MTTEVEDILEEEGGRRRKVGEESLKTHPLHIYAASVNELDRGTCRFCEAALVRGLTVKNKGSWFDAEADESGGHPNHWATCAERSRAKAWSKTLGKAGHLPLGRP